ncbi:hypothetical protein StoSoilB13_49320 (plasmid) [Arthrobacter sp. StoSoilB13]|nr:hypothetical protein StoSoilB13_49320 [Arthrobacter sp. StoSoilB13]
MNHRVAANQAVGVRCRTRADHAIYRIDHHKRAPDDGKHFRCTFRKQGFGNIEVHDPALPLADPESEHAKDAQ